MFLHIWYPQPLIATIHGFQLHWYGLCLAVAAVCGMLLLEYLGKKYALDPSKLFDLGLITLVSGFIGARLYHVINEWTYYSAHPNEILKVWNGGLALHGGLLFGLGALIIVARRWKMNPWLIADIAVPALALGQAIGRWGNYFNQELFGKPTTLPWGIPIDIINRPSPYAMSAYFHPTFLYESIGLLIIVVITLLLHRRQLNSRPAKYGSITIVYVIGYSLLRMATEFLRLDRTPIIGGVRLPILMSGVFIFIALALYVYRFSRRHDTA